MVKKTRINYKRVAIFIVILCIFIFGIVKGISFIKDKLSNPKVEKYIASSTTSIDLYDLKFQKVDTILRGSKVEEYEKTVTNKETKEVYNKIQ